MSNGLKGVKKYQIFFDDVIIYNYAKYTLITTPTYILVLFVKDYV